MDKLAQHIKTSKLQYKLELPSGNDLVSRLKHFENKHIKILESLIKKAKSDKEITQLIMDFDSTYKTLAKRLIDKATFNVKVNSKWMP